MDNKKNYSHHSPQFTVAQLMEFGVISNADIWSMLEHKKYVSKELVADIIHNMNESDLIQVMDRFSQKYQGMHLSKELFGEIISQMGELNIIPVLVDVLKKQRGINDLPEQIIQLANYKLYGEDVLKHQRVSQVRNVILSQVDELVIQ